MKDARIVVETCMNIKPSETVLVVTDTGKLKIAEAFAMPPHLLGKNRHLHNGTIKRKWRQHIIFKWAH